MARSDKIAGRDDAGIALLQWGAQVPNHYLCALARPPIAHGTSQRTSVWPFLAMPALSLTMMCARMFAGASEAFSTIGSVVEDVETVVGASFFDALALEATIVHARILL